MGGCSAAQGRQCHILSAAAVVVASWWRQLTEERQGKLQATTHSWGHIRDSLFMIGCRPSRPAHPEQRRPPGAAQRCSLTPVSRPT